MKECTRCKKTKSDSEFYRENRSRSRNRNGLKSWCKVCFSVYFKQRNEITFITRRKKALRKSYGITIEEYDEMYSEQKGRCAICGVHQSELNQRLNVDHCHKTGEIRKLLCNQCNRLLGRIEGNIELVKEMLKYIVSYKL